MTQNQCWNKNAIKSEVFIHFSQTFAHFVSGLIRIRCQSFDSNVESVLENWVIRWSEVWIKHEEIQLKMWHHILTLYHVRTRCFKTQYLIELKFTPQMQTMWEERCPKLRLKAINISDFMPFLFLFLSPSFWHSNQEHRFDQIWPNSDNNCKML